jgi:hypothetical protein
VAGSSAIVRSRREGEQIDHRERPAARSSTCFSSHAARCGGAFVLRRVALAFAVTATSCSSVTAEPGIVEAPSTPGKPPAPGAAATAQALIRPVTLWEGDDSERPLMVPWTSCSESPYPLTLLTIRRRVFLVSAIGVLGDGLKALRDSPEGAASLSSFPVRVERVGLLVYLWVSACFSSCSAE